MLNFKRMTAAVMLTAIVCTNASASPLKEFSSLTDGSAAENRVGSLVNYSSFNSMTPTYMPDTHYVEPYYRQNGTYIQGHRSGNPGSGVHCNNNVCY